jgi:hypothetical protein
VTERTFPVDDVGLVPFGMGLERGLDERSLCTRGIELETLAGLGLPVGAGLTVPVPNVPGFTSPDRAKAAIRLLESMSGRTVGTMTEAGGVVLLRLSASALSAALASAWQSSDPAFFASNPAAEL